MLMFAMAASPSRSGGQDGAIETSIIRIANGEKEGLAQLYQQTHAAVYGFALSILKNREDAEDVTHDAYIRIWSGADSYTPAGKPLAWIFTITRNLACMRLREQARMAVVSPEDWGDLFDCAPGADQEDRLILTSLLGTLSDQEQQIVMLHAMTGLKHREIAELFGLGLPTVLSKYSRALKKLRSALKEADES